MVKDKRSVGLVVGALLTGCLLRCWNINQSFWWDEIWSTMTYVRANSLWDVVSSLGYYFNNHILYSLLARISVQALGESEFAARLPAVVMGILGISAIFRFGKQYLGNWSGMVAAFLLSLSAFHIEHSSEARGYAGLALFSILSSFYFFTGLKTNTTKAWTLYILCTVLGFYSHVFMIAVAISQFCSCLLFLLLEKWHFFKSSISPKSFRNFSLAFSCAGVATLVIFSPVLPTFLKNVGKVQLVTVSRFPFFMSLADAILPGSTTGAGSVVYSILFLAGMYFVFKKDHNLFLYFTVLFTFPLTLYLLINPMFVFERYFIFTLPFVLLVMSQGTIGLAERLRGAYKYSTVIGVFAILVLLQLPALGRTLGQDRQNYREAVHYVTDKITDDEDYLIFSIGFAGEHFRYYTSGTTIQTPQTVDELSSLMQGKKQIWCLITAWLPDIRPPHEDENLYTEQTGQAEIYNFVKKEFMLKETFFSKYPVDVYYLQR
jgi:uncharacterized membrane protein